jgi:hypothetical protein
MHPNLTTEIVRLAGAQRRRGIYLPQYRRDPYYNDHTRHDHPGW